jgi:hypothetical protein
MHLTLTDLGGTDALDLDVRLEVVVTPVGVHLDGQGARTKLDHGRLGEQHAG